MPLLIEFGIKEGFYERELIFHIFKPKFSPSLLLSQAFNNGVRIWKLRAQTLKIERGELGDSSIEARIRSCEEKFGFRSQIRQRCGN